MSKSRLLEKCAAPTNTKSWTVAHFHYLILTLTLGVKVASVRKVCGPSKHEIVDGKVRDFQRELENERDFDRAMMRPRSRQAAALNMCLELEGRVMSMLVGENSDWLEFCNSFESKKI